MSMSSVNYLTKSGIGGKINGTWVNRMLYADDICVISLSSAGLQQMFNICNDYCNKHDLILNKKSQCVCISTLL